MTRMKTLRSAFDTHRRLTATMATATATRLTFLAVDDNPAALNVIRFALRPYGETLLCKDGRSALSLLQHQHVDLVVLDLQMPDMSGYEVARRMRETHPSIPVLGISGDEPPPGDLRLLNGTGARVGFCLKPARPADIAKAALALLD